MGASVRLPVIRPADLVNSSTTSSDGVDDIFSPLLLPLGNAMG